MFKIVRFPKKLESFFDSLQSQFHWDHFQYFRTLVLLIIIAWGRRNISSLYRHLDRRRQPHRSRFNNFLNVGRCDYAMLLQRKAHQLLVLLNPQKGDLIDLILDDSKKQKRGSKMEAVSWIHDPVRGRSIKGHQYVTAVLRFRGHAIPWGVRLYLKKEDAALLGQPFKKTTQLAADLIGEFEPPKGVSVRVLFDSYYLCPTVVKACRKKGFRFVSTLKSNRNLYKNGRKLKVGAYGHSFLGRKRKQTCRIQKTGGRADYTYVEAGWIEVSDLGPLHVICFAYALLTHIAIGEGAKAKRKPAVKLSTADLQNEARRIVWEDLTDHLKTLSSGTQVVKELERLLIAA